MVREVLPHGKANTDQRGPDKAGEALLDDRLLHRGPPRFSLHERADEVVFLVVPVRVWSDGPEMLGHHAGQGFLEEPFFFFGHGLATQTE